MENIKIEESLEKSYLEYSMSVIVGRALPDVRDGLKPVHRRILYSMNNLNLFPKNPYKKSARITGDCLVAGSLISTKRGLIPIEYIEVGDEVWTKKGFKKVTQLFFQPEQPLLKVIPKNELFTNKVTYGHKFKVLNIQTLDFIFKRADELTSDDYLVLQPALNDIHDTFTKKTARNLGIFLAKKNKKVKRLKKFLRTILNLSNQSLFYFLSGYLETNGTILNNEIKLFSSSKDFLNSLGILLFDRFGIISEVQELSQTKSVLTLSGKNANFFQDKLNLKNEKLAKELKKIKTYWDSEEFEFLPGWGEMLSKLFNEEKINISMERFGKIRTTNNFDEVIHLYSHTVKNSDILEKLEKADIELYKKLKFIIDNKIVLMPISSIEKAEDEITYDFTVEDVHEFIVNGVVSHNCLALWHPHGDSAVYEALVRMAQDFSMRNPIVDGQGNFGSIDGDNPAAQRYTEARLTPYAEELLRDIDKKTVDFVPNYDNSTEEPTVLPTRVPNLLINGSNGIAVGMATNIPPHRLDEVIDGVIKILENPKTELGEILEIIQGPDFPTGGIIFGKEGIREAYKNGRGRIKVRAKIDYEKISANREAIIINEIPYQVNKSRLIEQIANLVKTKTIEGISDIRDESDRNGIRVVIELKKGVIREIVENNLFKSTNLEITFGINLLAIKNREPKVFNLIEILNEFISHRKSVVIRRTVFELRKAEAKAHILEGLFKAFENIDEVVKIIRASKNTEVAKIDLQTRFQFTKKQATAILDMKLHKLTSLEKTKLVSELEELQKKIKSLNEILSNENRLKEVIKNELLEVKDKFSSPRRTKIVESYDGIDDEDLIPNLPMVVTITNNGYIKRVALSTYEKQNRGGKGKVAVTTYDDDFIKDFFTSNAHDTLLIITNLGQLFWLKVYKIPEASRQAKGKAIVNLIQLRENETIKAIIPTSDFSDKKSLCFFTKNGIVKRTNLAHFSNIRSNGVKAIILNDNDQLVTAQIADENSKFVSIFTSLAQAIRFDIRQVREQGRSTKGVIGIKIKKKDDFVVDAIILNSDNDEVLTVSENGLGKRTLASEYRLIKRAGSGVISMKLSNRTGQKVIGAIVVNNENEKDLMILTQTGKLIRISFQDIKKSSRNTSGVTLIRGDKVTSIALAIKEEIFSNQD